MEPLVELLEHALPVDLALFDLIELSLHTGGELDVDDILEVLHHKAVHDLAERRGGKTLVDLLDIFAVLDRRNDRRVRRRAANALFLHCAHERRLGVPRGRLGKMLLRVGR